MRYRVGEYQSLVEDFGYVVQRKVWYGWKTIAAYWDAKLHSSLLQLERASKAVRENLNRIYNE